MNKTADLKSMIPTIVAEFVKTEHEIEEEWTENTFIFDKDGWYIEVTYYCKGVYDYDPGDYDTPECTELLSAEGEVENMDITCFDDESGEDLEISDLEYELLKAALNAELEEIED